MRYGLALAARAVKAARRNALLRTTRDRPIQRSLLVQQLSREQWVFRFGERLQELNADSVGIDIGCKVRNSSNDLIAGFATDYLSEIDRM